MSNVSFNNEPLMSTTQWTVLCAVCLVMVVVLILLKRKELLAKFSDRKESNNSFNVVSRVVSRKGVLHLITIDDERIMIFESENNAIQVNLTNKHNINIK